LAVAVARRAGLARIARGADLEARAAAHLDVIPPGGHESAVGSVNHDAVVAAIGHVEKAGWGVGQSDGDRELAGAGAGRTES